MSLVKEIYIIITVFYEAKSNFLSTVLLSSQIITYASLSHYKLALLKTELICLIIDSSCK